MLCLARNRFLQDSSLAHLYVTSICFYKVLPDHYCSDIFLSVFEILKGPSVNKRHSFQSGEGSELANKVPHGIYEVRDEIKGEMSTHVRD